MDQIGHGLGRGGGGGGEQCAKLMNSTSGHPIVCST